MRFLVAIVLAISFSFFSRALIAQLLAHESISLRESAAFMGRDMSAMGHDCVAKVEALKQIWLYVLAPLLGAGAAGYLFRSGVLAAETVIPARGEGGADVPPAASAPREKKRR